MTSSDETGQTPATMSVGPDAPPVLYNWKVLRVLALILLAIKIATLIWVRPFMDETYYFMWGQHPGISYFDHPPLIGWIDMLSGAVFGWTRLALRVPVLVTLLGDLVVLYLFARRWDGDAWRPRFWLSVVLLLTTPVFFVMTGVALPDHLMILALLVAFYALELYFAADGKAGRARWMYVAGVAIGAAMLAKYYAILAVLGVVLFAMVSVRGRSLLRDPHFYLAALLAALMQTPVIVWNFHHDFASFRFITGGRYPLADPATFSGLIGYLLGIVVMVSPFLIWATGRFAFGRGGSQERMSRTIFWVSTLAFLAASFVTNIIVHWNLVAYVAMLPHVTRYLRSRVLLGLHIIFGLLTIALVTFNWGVVPVAALLRLSDQTSSWSYGWDEVAAKVKALSVEHHADFIAATDYTLASPLGFELQNRDVTSLSPRAEQYDYWFDADAHRGQTAIIVADRWRGLGPSIAKRFGSIEDAGELVIRRFDLKLNTVHFYIGRDFGASSQAQ